MRVRLSDGTTLNINSDTPAKRRTKGSRTLKRYNSYKALSSVGGTLNLNKAIAAPPDQPLCVCVEPTSTTWDLGGSTRSPYRGGRGA